MENIGIFLKQLRTSKNFTTRQIQIISHGNISNSYLSLIENGKRNPSVKVLKILSDIYSYSFTALLYMAGFIDKENVSTVIIEEPNISKYGLDVSLTDIKNLSQEQKNTLNALIKVLITQNKKNNLSST